MAHLPSNKENKGRASNTDLETSERLCKAKKFRKETLSAVLKSPIEVCGLYL